MRLFSKHGGFLEFDNCLNSHKNPKDGEFGNPGIPARRWWANGVQVASDQAVHIPVDLSYFYWGFLRWGTPSYHPTLVMFYLEARKVCVRPQSVFRNSRISTLTVTIWTSSGNIEVGKFKNWYTLWNGMCLLFFAWFTAWTSHSTRHGQLTRQNHWILHRIARAHEGLPWGCFCPQVSWQISWKVGDLP